MKQLFIITPIVLGLQINAQVITTIAGNGTAGYSGDGAPSTAAKLNNPTCVAADASGNVYIADYLNNRIRKINIYGDISTIAGTGTAGFSGDGSQANGAKLNKPTGVCVDGSGNIYIADYGNNRIRKITSTGIISTIAGNGTAGFSGDGGAATSAELNSPYGVYFTSMLYVADQYNNRIREINTSGIISTVAGNGTAGFSGDGGLAVNAGLYKPTGVFSDYSGHLCIVDMSNNRIRMVSNGYISTIVGTGVAGYSGDGGKATNANLYYPYSACTDASGNIYIADYNNTVIRKVTLSDTIKTFSGNGTVGYSGDGGQASMAQLSNPAGICSDASGNLYIADKLNNRIRKVNSPPKAIFSLPLMGCVGSSINFTNNSLNATSYTWQFGDGGTSTSLNASNNYSVAGTYTATLVAFNASGNDSVQHSIIIYPLTTTIMISGPTTFCLKDSVILTSSAATGNLWYKNSILTDTTKQIIVKASGSYVVKDNNNTCAPASNALTVTVNSLPIITVTSNTISLCIGNTATLTTSGANTYTWNTNQTGMSISITPAITTTYTVTGTDVNDCINKSTITQVVANCSTTHINQAEINNSINIYPNPNNGDFVIETNSSEKQTLKIFDITGKLVLSQSINDKVNIDAGALNAGVYNLSLVNSTGVTNKRIVISR